MPKGFPKVAVISMKINENQEKSMKMNENQQKLKNIEIQKI